MTAFPRAVWLAGLASVLAGCQLVFGLDGFETEPGSAAGGEQAGGAGAGSAAGGGGDNATGGSGAGCACGLDPIWQLVEPVEQGLVARGVPDKCGDQSDALNLLWGEEPAMCSSCGCTASGCEAPGLTCYQGASCQGAGTTLNPSTSCGGTGTGYESCELAGSITGSCEVSGGEPVQVGPPYASFASFCPTGDCNCQAPCIAASGDPAGGCPSGFPHRYTLPTAASIACEACSCDASCGSAIYRGGVLGCGDVSVSGPGCVDVTSVLVAMFNVRFAAAPTCTTNHDATFAGSVVPEALHTVCCQMPQAGLPGPD